MARARQPECCFWCGEELEPMHRDMGKNFVGDTFAGYKKHTCDPEKRAARQKEIDSQIKRHPIPATIKDFYAVQYPEGEIIACFQEEAWATEWRDRCSATSLIIKTKNLNQPASTPAGKEGAHPEKPSMQLPADEYIEASEVYDKYRTKQRNMNKREIIEALYAHYKTESGVIYGQTLDGIVEFIFSRLSHPSPQSEQAGEKVETLHPEQEKQYPILLEDFGKDFLNALDFMQDYSGDKAKLRVAANTIMQIADGSIRYLCPALWQAASQEKGVGWVSIADNLHENITVQTNDCTIDVLVRTNNADSPNAVAFYNKKRKEWWLSEKDDVELTVTHWMKLPALPAPPKPNNE